MTTNQPVATTDPSGHTGLIPTGYDGVCMYCISCGMILLHTKKGATATLKEGVSTKACTEPFALGLRPVICPVKRDSHGIKGACCVGPGTFVYVCKSLVESNYLTMGVFAIRHLTLFINAGRSKSAIAIEVPHVDAYEHPNADECDTWTINPIGHEITNLQATTIADLSLHNLGE